jgi:hypothetical protein
LAELLLRARSSTELVDAAVQLLRRHYSSMIVVSGIGMIPMLILQPFMGRLTGSAGATEAAEVGDAAAVMAQFNFGAFFIIMIATSLWVTLAGAAIIAAAAQGYREGHVDVGAAVREVMQRMGAVLYSALAKGVLITIGFFMLFIGAVFFYTTYFAVPATVIIEKLSGTQGLARSKQLATGQRWHIFKTMLLVVLVYFVISIGASAFAGMFFTGADIIANIFSTLITVLVYPIVPITEMLLYFDLRIRTEGYDVEVMASQLDGSAAPSAP